MKKERFIIAGLTPLHIAVQKQFTDGISYLIRNGANVNAKVGSFHFFHIINFFNSLGSKHYQFPNKGNEDVFETLAAHEKVLTRLRKCIKCFPEPWKVFEISHFLESSLSSVNFTLAERRLS